MHKHKWSAKWKVNKEYKWSMINYRKREWRKLTGVTKVTKSWVIKVASGAWT